MGVEGSSAIHPRVVDRHPIKGAEERVDQGLVMVDLRTRSMIQSCMPRVCVRCTTTGAPRRQQRLHPQKTSSRGNKLRRWDNPGRIDGSCPQEGVGAWSRWVSLPGLFETSRLLLHVWVTRAPRGCRLGELFQRTYLSYRTRFTSSLNLCWALLELVVWALCAGRTSAICCPQVSFSPGRKAL